MAKAHLRIIALIISLSACLPACAQNNEEPQSTPSPSPAVTASPANPGDSTGLIVIKAPKPSYPLEAERNGVQGKVWIHLVISETGDVESADIISGDPDLARAALEAMKKWKFKPYIHNGKPVKVNTKMPFDFAFANKVTDATAPPVPSATSTSPAATGTSGGESSGSLPQKLRVSSGVVEGLKLHTVAPTYPLEARIRHIQGDVLLQATIGKDGLVRNLRAVSGDPILIKAAMGAVEQWRYRPYVLKGEPVEVETMIKVQFHM